MILRYILILFVAGFLAACGGTATQEAAESEAASDTTEAAETTEAAVEADVPATEESAPAEGQSGSEAAPGDPIEDEAFTTTESGLQYAITEEGDGESPEAGEIVEVHYSGTLEDGTKFDSSYDRGQPIEFVLGRGQVIPGWDEGIALLNVGDKATLRIPPELAYGEQGAGGGIIPPNATLIFEVELLGVSPAPPPPPEAPTEVEAGDYTTTESGLQYYDLEEGSGESPEAGQTVTVHYTGWLEDGTMFDSSLSRGQPFNFTIGTGQVIPGWDEGVASMQEGGTRQLVIPPELAYGEQGAGGIIPPDATLIFEVELLEVE